MPWKDSKRKKGINKVQNIAQINFRMTQKRRKRIETFAHSLGVKPTQMFRYAANASFILFEGKTPKEAQTMVRESNLEELQDEIESTDATREVSKITKAMERYKQSVDA